MSVFGGDSWAREAQYRKRRVDDLIIDNVDASVYKNLSNGKFTCLVCPNNPILDTPTVLLAHVNGSRHRTAESKRKDKELAIHEEVQKRIALSGHVQLDISGPALIKHRKIVSKPLIERTRKAASEVLSFSSQTEVKSANRLVISRCKDVGDGHSHEMKAEVEGVVGNVVSLDYRARLEMELKFTAAGWKRDGYGKWFKDENAEFDSDDEDPNVVLNGTA